MKFINRLEHSHSFWFLLFTSIGFFLLRLPSIIEPYWYGDEGIYEVIGQALRSGRLLYAQIWDNKPPLLYLIYALFNGNQSGVRLTSLFVGLVTVIIFYDLGKTLFSNRKTAMAVTVCFALLFATPLIEGNIANAENFMLLPILCAALLLYRFKSSQSKNMFMVFLVGLLLGIAFMIKIVAIFDLVAFLSYSIFLSFPLTVPHKRFSSFFDYKAIAGAIIQLRKEVLISLFGFFLPLLITIAFFASKHAVKPFFQATFMGNVSYVGEHNILFFSQGLLLMKVLLLTAAVLVVFRSRDTLAKNELFIILWFLFSTFNTFFSQRPYTHYLLVLLPSFCLVFGLLSNRHKLSVRLTYSILLVVVSLLILINFTFFGIIRTVQYYGNTVLFLANHESVTTYQTFFNQNTPRDYEVAYFIKSMPVKKSTIFIWGDHAQIYALSNTLPPGRFTTAYHINQNGTNIAETAQVLIKSESPAIITLSDAPAFPFALTAYPKMLLLKGATIYEKDL